MVHINYHFNTLGSQSLFGKKRRKLSIVHGIYMKDQ